MGVTAHTVLKMCHHSSVINRHIYTTPYHHTDKHTHIRTQTYIPANGQVSRVPKAMQADTLYGFWDRQSLIHSWKCLDENVLVAWGKTESKIQTNKKQDTNKQTKSTTKIISLHVTRERFSNNHHHKLSNSFHSQ